MYKSLTKIFFILIFALFIHQKTFGQFERVESPKRYVIERIDVTGLKSFNKQTVISFSGLSEGQIIIIPGNKISQIIKKLWNLQLFNNVNVYITNINNDKISLEINVEELPTLTDYKIKGIKKGKIKELVKEVEIKKGKRINENFITTTKRFIINKYKEKGFIDTKVTISLSDAKSNSKNMLIRIDKGKKIRIKNINISGNKDISDYKLRSAMSKTKKKRFLRFYKRSKFVKKDYDKDLEKVLVKFKKNGFRDARLLSDNIYRKGKFLNIDLKYEEGRKYYFGDISFIGNAAYSDRQLKKMLGIKKGDTYNGVLLEKRIADNTKPDAQDLTNLYQNNGYLFSSINPVEIAVKNDTIDFEIRITEGKQAYFSEIRVSGNDRTNDHVIYRNIRTLPGELYSKQDVVRTVRELSQTSFFDPEKINPKFENVDPNNGTLDINYILEEKGSSQVQLQGGYGGGSFIGTIGLSFNNFSLKNILNGKEYRPVPLGDGQKLAIRAQASQSFNNYSFSFTEPWLGGKRPIGLTVSLSQSTRYQFNNRTFGVDKSKFFNVYGLNVGLSKRLRKPDNYFTLYQGVNYNYYQLNNYNIPGLFTFGNGYSNSIAYIISLGRDSSGPNPIYPMVGSKFGVTLKLSPPYSLFSNTDYAKLGDLEEFKQKDSQGFYLNNQNERVANFKDAKADISKIDQEKYRFLEFFKFKFNANWYLTLVEKMVLRLNTDFGILSYYNKDRGIIPFERFFVGGSGLLTGSFNGQENIRLRGYTNSALSNTAGSTVYNKFSMELRYPITLKPSASIYGLMFLEGGNAYDNLPKFNPFVLKKSAGLGIRIFMQAFGLLGFDFGYGFDSINDRGNPSGWQTHFIIGQNF